MFGNRKFDIKMVCFLIGPVPMPARSEEILPSPKMKGLKRDRRTAVPISPAAGLATSRQELKHAGQLMPLSTPETKTRRDPYFSQQESTDNYAVKKKVTGSMVSNGSKGCLSVADKLPGNTTKKKKKQNGTSPSLKKEGKISNRAGNLLTENMVNDDLESLHQAYVGRINALIEHIAKADAEVDHEDLDDDEIEDSISGYPWRNRFYEAELV